MALAAAGGCESAGLGLVGAGFGWGWVWLGLGLLGVSWGCTQHPGLRLELPGWEGSGAAAGWAKQAMGTGENLQRRGELKYRARAESKSSERVAQAAFSRHERRGI